MSSQAFLWVNVGLGLFLGLIFLLRKKGAVPLFAHSLPSRQKKSGPVIFIYNGHNFEAHEVLGLPLGASNLEIQSVYKRLMSEKRDDCLFLEAAFEALQPSFKNSLGSQKS